VSDLRPTHSRCGEPRYTARIATEASLHFFEPARYARVSTSTALSPPNANEFDRGFRSQRIPQFESYHPSHLIQLKKSKFSSRSGKAVLQGCFTDFAQVPLWPA
jgi:hypothetical protein